MRAYILRRVGFIQHARGGVILLGRRDSRDFLRLQSFLARNGYPVEDISVDEGPTGKEMAQQLGLKSEDFPVVAAADGLLLRNPSNSMVADQLGIAEPPDP